MKVTPSIKSTGTEEELQEVMELELDQADLKGCIIIRAFVDIATIMFTPHLHSMLVYDLKAVCIKMMRDIDLHWTEMDIIKALLLEATNGRGDNAKKLYNELMKHLK